MTDSLRDGLTELASLLVWPLLHDTFGSVVPPSLAIVPVGPLARLPWAALPLPDGRMFCEATEIVVVPGLRLGMTAPRERANAAAPEGPPLVVAAAGGELDHAEREARALIECFPEARLLTGADATVARFLELAPHAGWIHFAGHGLYRADAPHESAIRFADRWLPAGELAGTRLSASWVTLSACQTARALVRPGEEWFGLARSLLLAGARRVIASQWDIEDEAAAQIMSDLYRRVADGESPGAGLAHAQTFRARAGAHPFEWAGFLLLGGPGAIAAGPRESMPLTRVSYDHPPSPHTTGGSP